MKDRPCKRSPIRAIDRMIRADRARRRRHAVPGTVEHYAEIQRVSFARLAELRAKGYDMNIHEAIRREHANRED